MSELTKVTFYTDYTETVNGTEIWVRLPGSNGATWKLPFGAELERTDPVDPPFTPEWHGCYQNSELVWTRLYHSRNNLERDRRSLEEGYELRKVLITPDAADDPAEPSFRIGDIVEILHAFVYNPHAGKIGVISGHDPDWVCGTYRVMFQDSGTTGYFNPDQMRLVIGGSR
jgi:hypothetical protein